LSIKLIVTMSVLLVCLLTAGCTAVQDFDSRLRSILKPYGFSIVKWEFRTIPYEVKGLVFDRHKKIDSQDVIEYFASVEQLKTLRSEIEAINSGTKQGDSASLEAELNRLQEQTMA